MTEVELWINGVLIADITKLVQNLRWKRVRNNSEDLSFRLDTNLYEQFASLAGYDPNENTVPYVTDVLLKRNGVYLFGTEIDDMAFVGDDSGEFIEVKATGFLESFAKRHVTVSYLATESTDIAWGLIDITQSRGDVGDDFGVTQDAEFYETGVLRDRDYIDQNVKDGVINLTQLVDGAFDFNFTHDRKFQTFEMQGSERNEVKFTWPYNIKSYRIPKSAVPLFNYVIGKGAGFGEEALTSTQSDADSRANYKTREKIATFNSVINQDVLDENTAAEVALSKELLIIPQINVTGNDFDLNTYGVGDRIPVNFLNHPTIKIDGLYRIEQLEVSYDDNMFENISLTFDDYGLA